MKACNEIRLRFPSRSANEAFARVSVAAFLMPLDPTVEELTDIKTAVSEAVTNCIVHAYPDGIGVVTIRARLYPDRRVSVTVEDKGVGIRDIPAAMTPLFTTAPEQERAGLGFAVMQSFLDKIRVRSHPGKGTAITLEKRLASREEGERACTAQQNG